MNKLGVIKGLLICLGLIFVFSSCDKEKDKVTGYVTFGANYHVINCITTVTIYLDGKQIGTLEHPTDTILNCNEPGNITKEVSVGEHTIKIEIRSEGGGCTEDIIGGFEVSENECMKIFIDYRQLFNKENDCDQVVIISEDEYKNAPDSPVSISDMTITGNCLNIKFSASGCDGKTWAVKLVDMENIAYSNPCQRTLRLSLENKEMCEAYITKEESFDIKDLQIEGAKKVRLNISGKSILYEY
ncbi:MAG: hypothetical protein LBV72_17190 [Tannerella sp.]|jgi:hypothetical protein|nr:hypothetical protein [Tannerella sp.]